MHRCFNVGMVILLFFAFVFLGDEIRQYLGAHNNWPSWTAIITSSLSLTALINWGIQRSLNEVEKTLTLNPG